MLTYTWCLQRKSKIHKNQLQDFLISTNKHLVPQLIAHQQSTILPTESVGILNLVADFQF